jgi:putative transposase
MKYQFIVEHRETHSVEKMARTLGVSRSGYYRWVGKPRSERNRRDEKLLVVISSIQKKAKRRYGCPRVTEGLKRRGHHVGHNHVARLMRENGLQARRRRRYRSTTNSDHALPVAENLLNRRFDITEPNVAWVTDITYCATAEGWLYLSVIMDVASRKIVGWSLDRRMKAQLVIDALMMAIMHRRPPKGIIFHSDRGSQYCSRKVRRRVNRYGFIQSMSRKGNCWDNAPAESFFKTLKNELWGHRAFRTREIARLAIFEYIEVFYNRQRLHSSLGYLTPIEFEQMAIRKAA